MEITTFYSNGMRLFGGRRSTCRYELRTTLTAFQIFFLGREWVITAFQGSCPATGFSIRNATMRADAPSLRRDGFTVVTASRAFEDATQWCIKTAVALPSGTRTHTVLA